MSLLFRGVGSIGLVVLIGIGIVIWFCLEFPVLEGSMVAPEVVALDETFSIVVTATNTSEKNISLDSIDIQNSFLDGFRVVSVEPKPKDTFSMFGMRSWDFGTRVAPGESMDVVFTLKAVELGHFSGDLDICNPNQDFYTLIADVVVRKALSTVDGEEGE